MTDVPDYLPLIRLFNRLFLLSYNTELVADLFAGR